jgi:glycosyltransferase involved in cell wall biosynthesis
LAQLTALSSPSPSQQNLNTFLISIITPVYNTNLSYFEDAINSVLNQSYTNWEWCICNDCSNEPRLLARLQELQKNPKIHIVSLEKNSGICVATNTASSHAKGDIITFLDSDDYLTTDALFELAEAFTAYDADVVYSDEALVRMDNGSSTIHAKPNFSPHYLWATNYICHLLAVKRELYEATGGIRQGFDGSQDHDLVLRLASASKKIFHIPKSLYFWRMYPQSFSKSNTVSKAIESGIKAVSNELARKGLSANISALRNETHYDVKIHIKEEPKVSIIIPTLSNSTTIHNCLTNILNRTAYKNYKIQIIPEDKDKVSAHILSKFPQIATKIQFLNNYDIPFNFSKTLNKAIRSTLEDYIVVIHDDVLVLATDWLERLIGFLQDATIGVVTGKLQDPNGKVIEMGAVLGLNGIASSMFFGLDINDRSEFSRAELIQNTSIAPSSMMAFRRDKFNEVDGFTEAFTSFNLDYDFSLKLKYRGYYNVIIPECKAIHLQSGRRLAQYASNREAEISAQDKELFLSKYKHMMNAGDPYYNPSFQTKVQSLAMTKASSMPPKEQQKHVAPHAMHSTLVSFIVPWYQHIPTTITSLLAQTHNNIEIIVIYDGECPKKFQDYITSLQDERIKFSQSDKRYNDWGHTLRNMAIDLLNKDSFATVFTGVDNYYLPTFTKELLEPLSRQVSMLGTYCNMVHNKSNWNIVSTRLQYSYIDCGCFMAKTDLAREFRWGKKVDWEDWIFIEKIIKKYGMHNIKKIERMLYVHN